LVLAPDIVVVVGTVAVPGVILEAALVLPETAALVAAAPADPEPSEVSISIGDAADGLTLAGETALEGITPAGGIAGATEKEPTPGAVI
jgi:hypothetical protein